MTRPIYEPSYSEIETASGVYFDVGAPRPEDVRIEDIAHALSNICRFNGHCRRFYSVAEHAYYVACKLIDEGWRGWALAALHHDDAEAYLGDVARPLKPLLGDAYRKLTIDVDAAIHKGLGEKWFIADMHSPQVKAADEWMLANEARVLLPSRGEGWRLDKLRWPLVDGDFADIGYQPDDAAQIYLSLHEELTYALLEDLDSEVGA